MIYISILQLLQVLKLEVGRPRISESGKPRRIPTVFSTLSYDRTNSVHRTIDIF
jgi:hypothetical protein